MSASIQYRCTRVKWKKRSKFILNFKDKDEELTVTGNRAKMQKKESKHFQKKTSKRRIFDRFARLWRFGHISLVRTPIDAIQDVTEIQQTGLQLCSFEYQLKMDTHDLARDLSRGEGRGTLKNDNTAPFWGCFVMGKLG